MNKLAKAYENHKKIMHAKKMAIYCAVEWSNMSPTFGLQRESSNGVQEEKKWIEIQFDE